jgi:tripartite-type tricarboxylate transporter receptor subunit TctC
VPTAAEAAQLPGFEAVSWYALMGPAGMPREIAAKIQADVAKAVQSPDVREKLRGLGAEPYGSTTAELVAAMRADYDRYGAIVKRIGLKLE